MIVAAVTSVTPAWLAVALVAITTLGAVINAVAGAINGFVQLRRLESLDAARTQREIAQHQAVLAAINSKESA